MKTFSMIPVVAVPISLKDILKTIYLSFTRDPINEFKQALKEHTGYSYVTLFLYGRTALKYLLEILHSETGKTEVIIPAYTCPSVLYSVINAGLIPVLADITPNTFGIDRGKIRPLINERTLAIIVVHMFGKMAEIQRIKEEIKNKSVFLIEDAAQACDSYMATNHTSIGTYGDFCLFSFGKGKNITTIYGGAILSNNGYIMDKLTDIQSKFPKMPLKNRLDLLIKLILYSVAVIPTFFYWVYHLPIKITDTNRERFPVEYKFSKIQASLGIQMLQKMAKLNSIRMNNGKALFEHLKNNRNFLLQDQNDHLYLSFPLICKNQSLRNRILKALIKNGIMGSKTNYVVLNKLSKKIKNHHNEFHVASMAENNMLILPTNPFVRRRDLKKIIGILNS